jgi:Fur family ferric uptake transcriptional regulator
MHHARATLREQGYRLTPQRNLIWEVLRDAGRHMTAEEVAADVRRTMPDVNVSTVYRTLELLVSLDLVVETRLEGNACYYEVSPEPSHHHFVCTRCGAVGHFGDELLAPVYDELGRRRDFSVGQIQLTAFGLCGACRGGERAAGPRPAARGDGRA